MEIADGRVIRARRTDIQLLEAGSPLTRSWGFAENIIRRRGAGASLLWLGLVVPARSFLFSFRHGFHEFHDPRRNIGV